MLLLTLSLLMLSLAEPVRLGFKELVMDDDGVWVLGDEELPPSVLSTLVEMTSDELVLISEGTEAPVVESGEELPP